MSVYAKHKAMEDYIVMMHSAVRSDNVISPQPDQASSKVSCYKVAGRYLLDLTKLYVSRFHIILFIYLFTVIYIAHFA